MAEGRYTSFGFVIEGAEELDAKLKTLPQKIQKDVIRKAVRESQKTLQKAAKASARSLLSQSKYPDAVDMSALIEKNIIVRATKKQKKGSYSIMVLLRGGIEEFAKETRTISSAGLGWQKKKRNYIPAAIEYGHMAGDTYVPPIPFMRSAAEATANRRMQIFTEQLRVGLLREAIKARS